jgi:hypothetical protein
MNVIEDTLVRYVDEDSAIGSFEWMELDTLSSEIATLEARVADARSDHDHRLVEVHKQEIASLQQRHARLLAHITTSLAGSAGSSPHPKMAEGTDPRQHHGLPEEDRENIADPGQQSAEVFDLITANHVAVPYANTTEGVTAVWDQLTPTDIERATHELDTRRAEMLARHKEEIKALSIEQSDVDTLAQAIEAFSRKFNFLKSPPYVAAALSVR